MVSKIKERLDKVRSCESDVKLSTKVIHSALIFALGIALGTFSKWVETFPIDKTIWWHRILDVIDLGNILSDFAVWLFIALAISIFSKTPLRASLNVFLFFAGMCGSYHFFTLQWAGFDPGSYMLIWYGYTLMSPILAFICWYGKGKTTFSLAVDVLILSIMCIMCFSVGYFYIHFRDIIYTLIFVASAAILYSSPKNTAISVICGIVLPEILVTVELGLFG